MKREFVLMMNVMFLYAIPINAQEIITFDNQGWNSDQSLGTDFTIDNLTFTSNKSLFTNYGYNFDVNHISIYYAFQNSISDHIAISTINNSLVNLSSLAAYQVSETGTDTLIIEGWEGSNKIYSTQFSNNSTWRVLQLDYNGINKLIIKSGNLAGGSLFDYNFDNISFNSTTDVEPEYNAPKTYSLSQNYPNPFNPSTVINYTIPSNLKRQTLPAGRQASNVLLKVYDILGNEVATLVDEEKAPGNYSVTFDAGNLPAGRQGLASGIYIYKLSTAGFVSTKKMLMLK